MVERKINIVFILPNLNAGGAERVTLNFIRQLDAQEYDVSLIVFDKTEDLLHLLPNHVNLVDLKTTKAIKSLLPLACTLKELSPSVVYVSHSRVAVLLAILSKVNRSFTLLSRVPSMPSLERKQAYTKPIVAKIYAWAYRSADIVLAQTEAMKEDVVLEYGVDEDQVIVAHNPLDTCLIDKLAAEDSPFEPGSINIVASGRHSPEKGFDVLIKAFANVVKAIPNANLTIVGRESEQTELLRNLVEELNLSKNIIFHGFTENPYKFYKNCDLFVLSSRREGFPNALLECHHLNIPIIASPVVPIVHTLVVNGANGKVLETLNENLLEMAMISQLRRGPQRFQNEPYVGFDMTQLLNKTA